ncbi:MAG TPA: hypothetical protein PLU87_02700 [Sedimentisphaerales bacterium]|nr:hypothetical protein [Sedimentisphaerales bacterium]HRS09932.1 hypothetical protein [Sedimentisphaerales bacterium]HRV46638.1 hypothetical protein [Sedimentisphaerales bacterium]
MKTAVLTVGQIAERLGQPPSRVAYQIAKQRLKPVARVGIIRLFSEQQGETIQRGLDRLQAHRQQNGKAKS